MEDVRLAQHSQSHTGTANSVPQPAVRPAKSPRQMAPADLAQRSKQHLQMAADACRSPVDLEKYQAPLEAARDVHLTPEDRLMVEPAWHRAAGVTKFCRPTEHAQPVQHSPFLGQMEGPA